MTTTTLQDKALAVHQCLREVFGDPTRGGHPDPIAVLVSTIISQNTNDGLRDQAFETLRQRFPTWEEVRDAPVEEVTAAIRIAGLGQQKAPHIQAALRHITKETGELSLGFLTAMGVEKAREWLTAMDGVGPKTAAIVLLFALSMPAFPVDTHIHRVTRRLGLIPPNTSREKAHVLLEALLPAETYYTFHLNVIQHGRQVCQARQPRCEVCLLRHMCDYYQTVAGHRKASRPPSATGESV